MSQVMQYTFHLFGARKGKTVKINGHQFVAGEFKPVVSGSAAATLMKVLSYYGAYAKGTPEYDAAVAAEKKEAGETDGAGEVHEAAEPGQAEADAGDIQPDGAGPAEVPADDSGADADGGAGSAGDVSGGDGHEDSGVPHFEEPQDWPNPHEPASVGSEEVKTAMLKLDPDNKDHWVQTGAHKGKPKLSAVEEAYGKAGLTRDDLEAALPGWTHEKAVEAALTE